VAVTGGQLQYSHAEAHDDIPGQVGQQDYSRQSTLFPVKGFHANAASAAQAVAPR